jgi:hypothetical protein
MKSIDMLIIVAMFGLLFIIDIQQMVKNRELQAQIDELKIIVEQKFLPAMILEEPNIR